MLSLLLPLKDLLQAKSRLAGLLRPSERRALTQAMAEDVLGVLAVHPAVERIVIVSDDPGASLLANKYRAQCWSEQGLGCAGLNPVLRCASGLLRNDGARYIVALHADLPLLCAEDVDAVLAALEAGACPLIGSDRHHAGTNLLAFRASHMPDFQFGNNSFARHFEAGRAAGGAPRQIDRPGIALDVDEPRDLAELLPRLRGRDTSHTGELLVGSGLGTRVPLALESMQLPVKPANTGADDRGGARG